MQKLMINGKEHLFQEPYTIAQMLGTLNIPAGGTAVAVNENIVMQKEHAEHELKDGDRVEIIRAIGGG